MRNVLAPFAAAAALLVALPAAAHDEMSVAGQVTAVSAKTIQLRMQDGKVVTLEVDSNTRVKMAGKPLGLKDLKVGQSVKALGFGDSMTDLVAIDLVISPPPAKAR
ncbi:DUF5666 domain-containing protein [Phenylobacterium sp. LH3H17]|uniref:DUF5666 domain-containing protein n=1 Tax=Phenylobacterium sp. LH3H17 TaxID=2903901 RepID=UPI0020C9A98D|nr:DUF5666 domain-containing protein [Phenylobacterium sp. LH3H17]UTP38226.1 DUF5666 domain-containing protein [Phenylobacterium sp. LH3H17]